MKTRTTYLSLFFLAALLVPAASHAATFSFETIPGVSTAGDTIVVRAYLDPGSDALNAVEGEISVSQNAMPLSILEVSVVQSAISVWAKGPSVSGDRSSLSFTGGTPGGITETHALLFTLILQPIAPGAITVNASKVAAYKNDGKGSAVPVTVKPFSLTITPRTEGTPQQDQWKDIVGVDTTPPEPFSIMLGSDSSVFDGKIFIMFDTTDSQSGIDHYEVKEGSSAAITTNAPYVLAEQSVSNTITVFAYDKAGNVQTATYSKGTTSRSFLPWVLVFAVLAVFFLTLILIRTRKRSS